ncbi:TRAP transporter small permease [Cognatishimia maritima]|uniref:TRAP transporter small permease protein n=1 Tax=Cognatishimia maritima TaxID=870908 RepID=A0A1M5W5R1_9RHOB|nr:TRAP transporter small permease [Cognatishimia maritima]SHH82817.1 TRAP-type C4-dicarboxylate transport system, small permease component [Cognatishimia maritima]
MGGLLAVLTPLHVINAFVLKIGRGIGCIAVAFMVAAILIQVFYRYLLNNALPWPDEAARFGMLWMMGLMAPTAFRRGGFVAIETVPDLLPKRVGDILNLFLLSISMVVLLVSVNIGYGEVTGFGGRFATASLYLPTSITFDEWFRIPRSWMMMSLFVGIVLLISVNIELLLRSLVGLMGGRDRLPEIDEADMGGAE